MALFKGEKDDERVSAAGDALLAGKVAKGVGGQVSIDGDWLTINHKGALGKTTTGSQARSASRSPTSPP
jgi:hypothetical protein